ncbi:MAG TPA: hypothetical protein VGQ09_19130 [Chitinophagaceae bacterium]|jgi:hypothetical protein|nr:hypothetical protein [Chitinophagaceae bacterium]
MKKIIFAAIFLLFISSAFADNFQLVYREGNNRYSVSYSYFRIIDRNGNKLAHQGYSDKYGRIIVNLNRGSYICEIVYRNRTYRKAITIDGSTEIREIQLQ